MQGKSNPESKKKSGKRGRPKRSGLSQNELVKLRMRRMRERKRAQDNLVPVEVWIPSGQRDILLINGEDLSAAAREAFTLLITKRDY